ncbi:MAG: dTDP-4-dehydrorhamnose 3,5-epimerase [Phycisphaerales bacterium]|nr:MAG: dTDP-4-dehydrorhamnose 3,5-epimerase [Phycisphaerales bacterium]
MELERLEIPDVVLITPKRHGDHRGYFMETYSRPKLAGLGIDAVFVQDNQSRSEHAWTLRGLHFQRPPHAQGKLVRVVRGRIWDVAVDVRRDSPTYGRWVAAELSESNAKQLWVPPGFAHGFVTLEPGTEVAYKVTEVYHPDAEGGVIWNDPELNLPWPIDQDPRLSVKDEKLPEFASLESPFVYGDR